MMRFRKIRAEGPSLEAVLNEHVKAGEVVVMIERATCAALPSNEHTRHYQPSTVSAILPNTWDVWLDGA